MLERLLSLLRGELEAEAHEEGPFERRMIAVAALLLEAMYIDHETPEREREIIRRRLAKHFGLGDETVAALLDVAEMRYAEALDDWEFAEAVRLGFDEAQRGEILTMLWEVIYADGQLAELETRLMDRLPEQLGISPLDVETARATAIARSGLMSPSSGDQ